MGNGKWGTEIWIWGPPDTAGERLLPRDLRASTGRGEADVIGAVRGQSIRVWV